MIVAEVFGSVDKAGGAALGADDGVSHIIQRLYLAALLDDDDLNAGCIAVGEVDLLQALLVDRHAGHADIVLAGLDAGNNGIKSDVGGFQGHAQLFGNRAGHLNVDADQLAVVVVFIGREGTLGRHMQNSGLLGIIGGLGLLAAGGHRQQQHCTQQYSKQFFHG